MRICPSLAYDNGIGSAFFTGFKKLFFMNIHLALFEITDIKGGPKVEIWVRKLFQKLPFFMWFDHFYCIIAKIKHFSKNT